VVGCCELCNPTSFSTLLVKLRMSTTSAPRLPFGARGIDLGDLALMLAQKKIVLSPKGADKHWTMHFGGSSGVLDVHETFTTPEGKKHRTIYSIPHANLGALLAELGPIAMATLMRMVRQLDFDDLARRRITVVTGLLTRAEEIDTVASLQGDRLVLDPERIAARVRLPEFLDELDELKDGEFFTLLSVRRHGPPRLMGHGFAITYPNGQRELLWLSSRRIAAEMEQLGPVLREAALRHGTVHPWDPEDREGTPGAR